MDEQGYMITEKSVTVFVEMETPRTINKDHANFDAVVEALNDKRVFDAWELSHPALAIQRFSNGLVSVEGDSVFYDGRELHGSIVVRILRMIKEGFDIKPMCNFLDRLQGNPSMRSAQDLYRFLESNDLPITTDGYFLAYKNVNSSYKDKHSNTFDNSVGATCAMPRNEVEDNPDRTCSSGLHFCSAEYLNGFWGRGGHTMVIKIDPADVVSIPTDYNNSKGRCSKYVVVSEITKHEDPLPTSSVYDLDDDAWDDWDNELEDTIESAYKEGYFDGNLDSEQGNMYDVDRHSFDPDTADDWSSYEDGYAEGFYS